MSNAQVHILVAEDDEVNLLIAEHILGKRGYAVFTAENGETAARLVQEHTFDLILMDIEMPVMDGLEATALIRSTERGQVIPIVALTAHTLPEKLEKFKELGMNDYIVKPFDIAKFDEVALPLLPPGVSSA
ncbi:MAG: response regulator [Bacteroidia bacterium]|nr:response regulator [Bacteroidia bacterium]